ncbi:MAG: ComEC/Rec2 family competence protein [Sulfurimonas sp.]|uniref:ComEC/Rec2 family competence protein n=1 Tax=Sulfurimonas sp. TaxID=2022749 RepID=UPI003D1406B9
MINFEFLPASNGDCIFITLSDEKFILIDGGYASTYTKSIKQRIKTIKENSKDLDLVVVTHVDNDHVQGILKLLGGEYADLVKKIWFNSGKILSDYFSSDVVPDKIDLIETQSNSEEIGIRDGNKLEDKIEELKLTIDSPIKFDTFDIVNDLEFTVISPNDNNLKVLSDEWNAVLKEELKRESSSEVGAKKNDYDKSIDWLIKNPFSSDSSIANGSSIAFILKQNESKFLFLADAHMDVIIDSLKKLEYTHVNPLKIEFVKLSHHGSKKNLNEEFLSLIDTDTYIVSTNGSPKHHHPNKETLAKIIDFHKRKAQACKFIFNYPKNGPLKEIFKELDFRQINDSFFHIEYNEKYNFYLKFPKRSNTGARLTYE